MSEQLRLDGRVDDAASPGRDVAREHQFLVDEALDREHDLGNLHKQQIRSVLTAAAHHGADAHALLTNARRSLEERPR